MGNTTKWGSSLVAVLVVFALFGGFFVPNAQASIVSLQVTSPNGSELLGGGTGTVTWTSTGGVSGDLIDIALVDDVLHSAVVIAPNIAFDASPYAWVGLPSVPNGSNYRVQIFKAGTSVPYDMSDGVFAIDNTPPTILSVTTHDDNGDGNVDRATVVFSEPVIELSFNSGVNFSIGGIPAAGISFGTPNDDRFDLLFLPQVPGTGAKTLVYTPGSGHDLATPGNLLAAVSVPATDAAASVFLSAKTKTTTTIEATFSEDIDGTTVNGSGNEFTVAGHIVSAAAEHIADDGRVVLTVDTMGTGETPSVTFTNIDNFRDPTGNQALSPQIRTTTDGIAPTLLAVNIHSNNANTAFAKVGNTITVFFTSSEAIMTPSVIIAGSPATGVANVGNA